MTVRTSAAFLFTWDTETDSLSEMIVVGKYAWLAMMFIMTVALASWLDAGYVNNYLQNTSMDFIMFS